MNIVIYREKKKDTLEEYKYLFDKLKNGLGEYLKIYPNGLVMDIFDVHVDFRCGDVLKLAGLRPDFYNTDSITASNFLWQSAEKVNGKEINTLDDIYLEIVQHCMDVFNGNNSLSKEVLNVMVEVCKEDPVVFLETVLGLKLLEYQKVYIREVFKTLKKQEGKPVFRTQYQCNIN